MGKGGWGNDLILAEDQKEYQRAATVGKKQKERNLMDEGLLAEHSYWRSQAGGWEDKGWSWEERECKEAMSRFC